MSNDYSQYYKEADAEASIAGRNDIKSGKPFWTPPTGGEKWKVSRVRILPPPADKEDDRFYTWVPLHNLPGVNRPVLCPSKHGDEYCPACEMSQRKRQQGDKDGAIKWAPSWRALVNVVVVSLDGKNFLDKDGNVTAEPVPLLWGIPKRSNDDLQQKIENLGEMNPGEPNVINITSPKHGRDVFVRRQGSMERTRYEVDVAQTASPMPAAMFPALEKMHSLSIEAVYDRVNAAQMKAMLAAPAPSPNVDPLGPDPEEIEDYVEGVFAELPPPAETTSDNPFADEDEDDSPFAEEEPDAMAMPAASAAPAAARMAEARAKLLAKTKK